MSEKKVQMTEEQARGFLSDICKERPLVPTFISDLVAYCKSAGYILPDPVEEAEEMYKDLMIDNVNSLTMAHSFSLCKKQHEAIQYLKQQIKKGE